MHRNTGIFYVVATPIGNLEDITFRAVRILKEVDLILCEDTRTSKILFDFYSIQTKTISYHAHSSANKHTQIITLLKEGRNIALVTDAGTPGISDPGARIISEVRENLGNDIVVPIPGPSAIIAAFSAFGVMGNEFGFLGFVPHKKGRETFFNTLGSYAFPVGFYESKHRLIKTLDSLFERFQETHILCIAREITKKFEEYKKGSISEIREYIQTSPHSQKGEFVLILVPRE